MPTLVAVGQITITDVNDAAQLQLSAQTVSLPADASGAVTSYAAATTTARVMQGGADVTSSWTLSKADTSCTSSLASGVVTVSAMSADSAYVDVTATRAGWPTLTARFALSKAKAGTNGQRVGVLEVYQWAASAPTNYPSGTSTYTWATGAFTAPTTPAGWSLTPGAAVAGQTLWGISVSVSDTLTTATSTATWSSATVYAVGAAGTNGAAGISTAVVYLYQRATSTPAVPSSTLTYTFATNALSGTLGAWTTAVPAGSNPLYVTVATAASSAASDTIGTAEWAAPVVLAQDGAAGAGGAAGAAGSNAATVYLFQRTASATAPALPSASVTYTFATGAATGLTNGWTQTLPTTGGAYRWVITATALSTGATDTIGTGEWAAAALLAQDGAAGAPAAYVRVQSDNYSANLAGYSAHAVTVSGTVLPITWSTGHTLVVLSPSGTVDSTTNYNTYASGTAGLVAALNAVPDGKIVALAGYDAGSCDAALRAALAVFGSGRTDTWTSYRVSHAFIGQRGLAAGCAYESVSSAANASGLVSVAAYFTAAGITANGATGATGASAISIVLSNAAHVVPADSSGTVTSWAGASTTPKIYLGAVDDTANWTLSKADTSCTSTLASGTVTVSALSADVGYVDITATRSGYATQTARFTVSKAKAGAAGATGATGATGAAGANATAYWLARSVAAVSKSVAGVYTPTSVTFSAYSATGSNAPAAYAGRFVIATSTDGSTYTDQYTSAANESSKAYTVPAGIKTMRVRLYLAGGTTTLLDEEVVPVVADGSTGATGATGAAGADATVRWVAKSAGAIALDVAGLYSPASLTFSAYSQTGTAAPAAYAGRFIIATSTDRGVTWTSQYTSAANESSTSYAPPAGVQLIRCRLYLAGGTTTLLDEEAVPVVEDGRGLNLIDSSWWAPGAAFEWTKADSALASETAIAWATGPRGDVVPVVTATADAINKLYLPQVSSSTSFWAPCMDSTGVADTFTVDTVTFNSSPSSFRLTKSATATNGRGRASAAVAVTPGQVWRVYMDVRGGAASAAGLYIVVNQSATMPSSGFVTEVNRGSTTTVVSNGAVTTSWVRKSLTYTVPAGVTAVSVGVYSWGGGPVDLYFDDPVLNLSSGTDSNSGPRSNFDGGWNSTGPVPIDPKKTYRYVVPVRVTTAAALRAPIYAGPGGNSVCTLGTSTPVANPYFVSQPAALPQGVWHWAVGYVYPAGSTVSGATGSGLYNAETGEANLAGTSFCWPAGATSTYFRTFCYGADIAAGVQFGQPMLHVVDGSEPSLASLTSSSALMNAQQQWSDVQAVPFTSLGGDADSTSMGFNGSFLAWPAAQQYPTGWGVWSAGAITRDTSTVREADGTPSLKMVAAGGTLGIQREVSFAAPLPAGSLLWGSIDCYIAAGNTGAPTLLVRLATSAGFATFIDTVVRPSATVTGGWQRLNWTARTANLTDQIYGVRCYLMGSYSGGGYAFTGTCYFENLFFEVVDKSIDNRSMQFSEVAGALSFTPSGNGTSSFTAVTANNKVTSGNVASYIQPGAITSSSGPALVSTISFGALSSNPVFDLTLGTVTTTVSNSPLFIALSGYLQLDALGAFYTGVNTRLDLYSGSTLIASSQARYSLGAQSPTPRRPYSWSWRPVIGSVAAYTLKLHVEGYPLDSNNAAMSAFTTLVASVEGFYLESRA